MPWCRLSSPVAGARREHALVQCPLARFMLLATLASAACGSPAARSTGAVIAVDGSSTVYPLTEAVAEEFQHSYPGARITIGVAGTGGGFNKFCRGETVLSNASRPITATERAECAVRGVEFVELPVAYDGITIVVHPSNTWADTLTVEELRRLWRHEAEGRVMRWSQVRAGFPDREIHLFGAGVDSGTFDAFTGAIMGAPRDSRGDYTSSEDDNILVQGVASDPLALGYFGFSYYSEHRDYLRAVAIRQADGLPAVVPTEDTIRSGRYRPLSRPVFVYVSLRALDRPDVRALVDYYVTHGGELAREVGYVPLTEPVAKAVRARVAARTTGSLYGTNHPLGATLDARLGVDQDPS